MVRHIVLFKLKDGLSFATRQELMNKFKMAIEALPAQISVIQDIEVGLNINADENWDIAIKGNFENLEDVKAYAKHPAHVAAGEILAEVKESRACVDYEY